MSKTYPGLRIIHSLAKEIKNFPQNLIFRWGGKFFEEFRKIRFFDQNLRVCNYKRL